jgi:hypothetical protein
MQLVVSLAALALLVLIVFALLLMVLGIARYAGFLGQANGKPDALVRSLQFIAFSPIEKELSFGRVFAVASMISVGIILVVFVSIFLKSAL